MIDVLRRELAAARAERDEAQAQQAALAEVLQAINGSAGNLEAVFDLLVDKAVALCGAAGGELVTFDGDIATAVSLRNVRPGLAEFWKTPQRIAGTTLELVRREGRTIHRPDMREVDGYRSRLPLPVAGVELGGIRTFLQVPLKNDRAVLGLFMIFRHEVRPFTDKQVALLEAFAAQAVIAMENARLITEQREALEQQTATTEVLEVINASPGDLEPVFGAMLEKAMHLCEAAFGIFGRFDGKLFEPAVDRGVPAELIAATRQIQSPPPNSGLGRIAAGESVVQLVDLAHTDIYRAGFVGATALVDIGGAKTAIFVALRKDGVLLGVIVMYRREVRAFSDKQVALLQTFAAQAVIAMENARLINETRQALEQQTATAEVLQVISQSPTDVAPVLNVVARAARRFCGANDVVIGLRDGDELVIAAHEGPLGRPATRRKLDRSSTQGRAVIDAQTIHIPDFSQLDPAEWAQGIALSRQFGFNSTLAAPMLRDGVAIGNILLRRPETGPFAPRQIALLETFAAQAVIAIENVRLFTELRESLEQQTATADILRAISQSPTDVAPVLSVVVKAAQRFCGAEDVVISLRDGEELAIAAHEGPIGAPPPRRKLDRSSTQGRAVVDATTIHLPDVAALDPAEWSAVIALSQQIGAKATLAAPMLREGTAVGAIMLRKRVPGPFTSRQIQLLEVFAAQAVIALENTRLFTELRESLDQQTATADILAVISQSPTDVTPVLQAVARAALRFCGAEDVVIALREDAQWLIAGHEGPMVAEVGARRALSRQTAPGQAMLDSRTAHFPDIAALDPVQYAEAHEFSLRHGFKAAIAAPMLREGVAVGAIALRRADSGAFTSRQIKLLESFAAQAVIALENTRLFTELKESLDYQTATSDLLDVISRSASDIQPVFDAMLASAARLCGVEKGDIAIRQGDRFRYGASIGPTPHELAWLKTRTLAPGRTTTAGRALLERQVVQVLDQSDDRELVHPDAVKRPRTVLAVPLLRDDEPIGVITLLRDRVEAFSERQIALIRTFADQAVIAMENARLLSELRQRTGDLTESLEYQTATSEVLAVISRSPADLQPVLEAMTAAAVRLCGVKTGGLSVRRGDTLRFVALVGQTPEFERWQMSAPIPIARGEPLGDAILDKEPVQIVDVMETEAYKAGAEIERAVVELGGHRTILHVPLLRDDEAVGALTVSRSEPQAFTERQIGLIETFADQAVIAMENARLLSELRESLAQQTATAEILRTINSSPDDLQPVFDTIVDKAMTLCDAAFGMFNTFDGARFHTVATRGVPESYARYRLDNPPDYGPATSPGRLVAGEDCVHIVDMADSEVYRRGDPNRRSIVDLGGARTILNVALRKDGTLLGMIVIYRQEVRPFTDKQIALLQSFADQAVIAIENARLLGELTRREEELRVTFDHMGDGVVMIDADLKLASWNRNFQELLDIPDSFLAGRPGLEDYVRLLVGRGELGGGNAEQEIERHRERASTQWSVERTRPDGRILEVRNNPVPGGGAVLIYSDVTERKRAEAEIRAARDAAESALDKLKAAQANLIQSEKMASLGQLTAGIAHEIKNPLNFVNNFATLSVELLDELKEVAGPALETLGEDRRAEVDETMSLLTGNLGKIAEHGKRADGIVRSMLSHSRGGSGDWAASDINALVEEALNLAYHGARAQDKEFNVTLERDFERERKPIEVVPQDVTRVFLNLFGNGFYAANKRRQMAKEAGARDAGFRPTLKVSTRDLGDTVEVRVRDNGIGITADVRAKLFQPFFTTKPTGEGTGLGLSISYDIVTQQHGGTIEVESEPGQFTEFTVRLPRARRVLEGRVSQARRGS